MGRLFRSLSPITLPPFGVDLVGRWRENCTSVAAANFKVVKSTRAKDTASSNGKAKKFECGDSRPFLPSFIDNKNDSAEKIFVGLDGNRPIIWVEPFLWVFLHLYQVAKMSHVNIFQMALSLHVWCEAPFLGFVICALPRYHLAIFNYNCHSPWHACFTFLLARHTRTSLAGEHGETDRYRPTPNDNHIMSYVNILALNLQPTVKHELDR